MSWAQNGESACLACGAYETPYLDVTREGVGGEERAGGFDKGLRGNVCFSVTLILVSFSVSKMKLIIPLAAGS